MGREETLTGVKLQLNLHSASSHRAVIGNAENGSFSIAGTNNARKIKSINDQLRFSPRLRMQLEFIQHGDFVRRSNLDEISSRGQTRQGYFLFSTNNCIRAILVPYPVE